MYNISREVLVLSQNYGLVGFKQNDGYIFYGNLKLNHQYNGIILKNDLYISMFVPYTYPNELPIVRDITKKIEDKFHKNANDVLCLACDAEMILDLKSIDGVTISDFIERYLLPYLYSYTYYKKYGKVPFGEREHGSFGIISFYKEYFDLSEKFIVISFLNYIILNKYRGHDLCLCGSGKKIRNCHGADIINLIEKVGISNIVIDYNRFLYELQSNMKKKRKERMLKNKKERQRKKLDYYLFPTKNLFEIYVPNFYEMYIKRHN